MGHRPWKPNDLVLRKRASPEKNALALKSFESRSVTNCLRRSEIDLLSHLACLTWQDP
jgi:hypothetical protein